MPSPSSSSTTSHVSTSSPAAETARRVVLVRPPDQCRRHRGQAERSRHMISGSRLDASSPATRCATPLRCSTRGVGAARNDQPPVRSDRIGGRASRLLGIMCLIGSRGPLGSPCSARSCRVGCSWRSPVDVGERAGSVEQPQLGPGRDHYAGNLRPLVPADPIAAPGERRSAARSSARCARCFRTASCADRKSVV